MAAVALVACGDASSERVSTTAQALTGPNAWVVDSMERVGRSDAPGSTSDALIHAARSEYESFQIVVQAPAAGLTHANVTVSDLAGPGGATLAASNVALFREQYATVTSSSPDWGGSNRPLGAGEYPDGLIPFVDPSTGKSLYGGTASIVAAPFSVAAGQNQPIWVDVYVPPGTRAGAYSGTYSVSSDQGTFSGKVAVDVWAFTLPAKPTLKSSFLFWNSVPQAAHEEMLRNKLDPLSVPTAEQSSLISQFGLESDGLPFFSGADVSNCTMSPAPSVASIQASAAQQAKGLYLYAYSADEIGSCTSLFPTVQAWGLALHQAGVDNLVTMAPVQQLFDDGSGKGRSAVDDWTVLPVEYVNSIATIKQALAKGDHVWSYNTLVQDAYSPKWEIDFHPLDFRIQPGFLSATQSLTGILYWRVDQWSPNPWMSVNNAGKYSSSNYPGEAQLLYPGQDVGIAGAAPSMRLKWLRDGVEDYDYVALLQQAGKGTWALQQAATIAPDWTNWTRSATALEAVREALGNALDAMGMQGGPGDGGSSGPADAGNASSGGGDSGVGTVPADAGDETAGSGDQPGASTSGCACVAAGAPGEASPGAWWLGLGLVMPWLARGARLRSRADRARRRAGPPCQRRTASC
ncbi:MAG TPA: glycoside hydrolase domain-containing protein [Polyangiaceae bacterium]